ncbi:hypothetical protein SLE2022_265250 [Rubroshorea leprosula]
MVHISCYNRHNGSWYNIHPKLIILCAECSSCEFVSSSITNSADMLYSARFKGRQQCFAVEKNGAQIGVHFESFTADCYAIAASTSPDYWSLKILIGRWFF